MIFNIQFLEILLGGLEIFASLIRFIITFFFCYKVYLIYNGTTSNEAFKWEDLGEDEVISHNELWFCDEQEKPLSQLSSSLYNNNNNSKK